MKTIRKILGTIWVIWGLLEFAAGMFLVLPFILMAILFFGGRTTLKIIYFFLNIWGTLIFLLVLIPVRVFGKEKLDKKRSYIFVANHNSYLDAPLIIVATRRAFKALGKIEMMKIPVFKIIYKEVCVLIDRSSKESRTASIIQLKKEIESGTSIFIFPEGTMNKNKDLPVADFYDGAFRIAIETQTAIAPMVSLNARHLMPRDNPSALRPGTVRCYFLDPIEVAGLTPEDLPALKERVHRLMTEAIIAHT